MLLEFKNFSTPVKVNAGYLRQLQTAFSNQFFESIYHRLRVGLGFGFVDFFL